MINVWNNMDIQIKVALIGATGTIIAAIIAGVFSLVKKDSNSSKKNGETFTIPTPKVTVEKQKYNAEEYIHNSFIPSLDDLEKESSDNAFAEWLAIFLGANHAKDSNSNNKNGETITIPTPKATVEKQKYNAEEYTHNFFIPSLDDLEKESSDNAFAERLAIFLGADRTDEDITITRKGE